MKQRRRHEVRSCGQHDLVERRVLGSAMVAIAHSGLDIGEAQAVQALFGLCAELLDDFHAVHLACELSEDRRLITKAGADLEHHILGTDVEQIRHQRYNEGLRDRLLASDRKRHVRIDQWLSSTGTNSCRGTLAIAAMTRSSRLDLPVNSRTRAASAEISATICSRRTFKSSARIDSIPQQIPICGRAEGRLQTRPTLGPSYTPGLLSAMHFCGFRWLNSQRGLSRRLPRRAV